MNVRVEPTPLQIQAREDKKAREERMRVAAPITIPIPRPLVPLSEIRKQIGEIIEQLKEWRKEAVRVDQYGADACADNTMREIIRLVSQSYDVPRKDIISSRRSHYIIIPRQIVMYLARAATTLSLPEIGRNIGHRDHTTVMHGANKVAALMRDDEKFRARVEALVAELMTSAKDEELRAAVMGQVGSGE